MPRSFQISPPVGSTGRHWFLYTALPRQPHPLTAISGPTILMFCTFVTGVGFKSPLSSYHRRTTSNIRHKTPSCSRSHIKSAPCGKKRCRNRATCVSWQFSSVSCSVFARSATARHCSQPPTLNNRLHPTGTHLSIFPTRFTVLISVARGRFTFDTIRAFRTGKRAEKCTGRRRRGRGWEHASVVFFLVISTEDEEPGLRHVVWKRGRYRRCHLPSGDRSAMDARLRPRTMGVARGTRECYWHCFVFSFVSRPLTARFLVFRTWIGEENCFPAAGRLIFSFFFRRAPRALAAFRWIHPRVSPPSPHIRARRDRSRDGAPRWGRLDWGATTSRAHRGFRTTTCRATKTVRTAAEESQGTGALHFL